MRPRVAALLVLVAALIAIAAARPAAADPSRPLANALWALQNASDSTFSKVVYWSRNGANRPFIASSPDQQLEVQILDLPSADRNAVLSWLQGNSRSALYARGARDSDIGSRYPAYMSPSAPTASPNPYRSLDFASALLGNQVVGGIKVLNGFAAVKRDGRAAIVCLSFRNVANRVADRVVFQFPLFGPRGGTLGELELDRRGEFSPGIDINGWQSLADWQGGIGNGGYDSNCRFIQQDVASQPLLQATGVSFNVTRVEYTDGTVWP